jgi:hypothetical protein
MNRLARLFSVTLLLFTRACSDSSKSPLQMIEAAGRIFMRAKVLSTLITRAVARFCEWCDVRPTPTIDRGSRQVI